MKTIMSQKKYILALNVGSTSIKSRVFLYKEGVLSEILVWSKSDIGSANDRKRAFDELYGLLDNKELLKKITAVGHRVVHGGPIKKSTKIGAKEIKTIKEFSELAPLHNPYNLEGIEIAKKWFGNFIVQVAVFDTAFFSELPERAKVYPISAKYANKFKLNRYGFHGISHQYGMLEAARLIKKPVNKLRLITAHLGGGSSITATKNGKAIDTSMGFTPLEGLVMGTRSGDIDPGIIFYLADKAKLSLKKVKDVLVHESGIYGISGEKNMLALLRKVRNKDKKAMLAFDIFTYRVQKYIGAYAAIMGGCNGIVFTGAVGSGDKLTRNRIVQSLKSNVLKNVPVLVIKPNEEKMIALEVCDLLEI